MKHLAKEHALQRRLGVRMATVRGELVASSGERYARVTRKPSAVKRPQQRSVRRGEEELVTIRRGDGGPSVCAEKGGAREVDAIGAGRCGRRWCVVGCADMGANMTSITDAPSSIPSSHVAYTAPAAATSTAAAAVAAAAVAAAAAAATAANAAAAADGCCCMLAHLPPTLPSLCSVPRQEGHHLRLLQGEVCAPLFARRDGALPVVGQYPAW